MPLKGSCTATCSPAGCSPACWAAGTGRPSRRWRAGGARRARLCRAPGAACCAPGAHPARPAAQQLAPAARLRCRCNLDSHLPAPECFAPPGSGSGDGSEQLKGYLQEQLRQRRGLLLLVLEAEAVGQQEQEQG
jgi:hypothetical protein